MLIYIFNVLLVKNIWTKENHQIQRNYPFKTIQCSLIPNTHFNNSCSVNKRNSNLIWERGSKFPNFIFFWICILYPIWTLFSMLRSLGNKHSVTYFYMYDFCSHTQGKKTTHFPYSHILKVNWRNLKCQVGIPVIIIWTLCKHWD